MNPRDLNLAEVTPEWKQCFELLLDPAVSEIECNGPKSFFMKRNGKREPLNVNLPDVESYVKGIERSLIPLVSTYNEWNPAGYIYEGPLEYRLQGIRVKARTHIALPPATETPLITLAKKSTTLATLHGIAEEGSMSEEMEEFLEAAVKARLCMAISGATGAGKTTMLEAISKHIPMDRRIGVAEDSPELELSQQNVAYLHSVPHAPGMDPNDAASLEWCVAQFNRMRTDLLIIGETRGKEFAAFLTAANSGMEGCLTTLHATTPRRCLEKMSNFALAGSHGQPLSTVNRDIATAVDIIIQLIILPDGRHRVHSITEVTPVVSRDGGDITISTLYEYNSEKDVFIKTGLISEALRNTLRDRGVNIERFFRTPHGAVLQAPERSRYTEPPSTQNVATSSYTGLPLPGARKI